MEQYQETYKARPDRNYIIKLSNDTELENRLSIKI